MKKLATEFSQFISRHTLIVGIGNELKGDDGVGIVLLSRLKGKVEAGFLECGIAPENYLEKIASIAPRTLVIIDAVDLGDAPGTMRIIRADDLMEGGISTHSLSPGVFIDYLRTRLRDTAAVILGIQPKSCRLGQGLSSEVAKSIDDFLNCL